MAEVRPFKAVRYNPTLVSDLASVVCPPYDVISHRQQNALYERSEYNFVRIEYNREEPQDTPSNSRYTRAAANIREWLIRGILKWDATPAIYIHDHCFSYQGKTYSRRNLLTLVRLEEWDKKIIRPHENIIPRAKSDRLSTLQTCQANTSPVLAMYHDPGQMVSALLTSGGAPSPLIDFTEDSGERHTLWAVVETDFIKRIQKLMAGQPLYIADGHHRYDSALTYRRERAAATPYLTGEEPFNFVMVSLIDVADRGLFILPTNRLVKGISSSTLGKLPYRLRNFFDITEISLHDSDVWTKLDALLPGLTPDSQNVRLAVFGLQSDKLLILTLRDINATGALMSDSHGAIYKKMDVSLVDHVILENLLSITRDKEESNLAFSHNRNESIDRVLDHQYQLAFLLNPVKPKLIEAIADAGDRMPRKSTYFYPKSPAGLVFYEFGLAGAEL